MNLKDYLQLFRAHTAMATVFTMLVAFYAGGGQLFSYFGLLVGVYALLVHWFSFGHNSLLDFKMGYDVADKNKQHHPLVAGRMTIAQADRVIHWGLITLSIIGIAISYLYASNKTFSISGLVLFYSAGHAYNDGLSKTSILKPIAMIISMIGMWFWAYFLFSNAFTQSGVLVVTYLALIILHLDAYEGELKEIESGDQANLLRYLGARVENGILYPGKAEWVRLLRAASIVVILLINTGFYIIVTTLALLYVTARRTGTRPWDRNGELVEFSVTGILSIYLIVIAIMSLWESIAVMIFGIVYYICMNKLMWNTYLRPQV